MSLDHPFTHPNLLIQFSHLSHFSTNLPHLAFNNNAYKI